MALGTLLRSTAWPSMRAVPATRAAPAAAKGLMASSVRPAPIRPATPTISPARTLKLILRSASRSGVAGGDRPAFTSSTGLPGLCSRCG